MKISGDDVTEGTVPETGMLETENLKNRNFIVTKFMRTGKRISTRCKYVAIILR